MQKQQQQIRNILLNNNKEQKTKYYCVTKTQTNQLMLLLGKERREKMNIKREFTINNMQIVQMNVSSFSTFPTLICVLLLLCGF